jgi:ribosomal-protein-alanine N-acetyltransferase
MIVDIETPRLLLRRWKASDLNSLVELNANPEVMRYFPAPHPKERTKQFYDLIQEEFSEYGYGLYAVEEKSSGIFIGYTGFHWATFDTDFSPCIEIGWRLHNHYWNKGYATEGAKACLAHGFTNLGFNKVYSFTTISNVPSQNVMKKIGMRFFKYFDNPDIPDNHPQKPHVCYVIDKDNYDASLFD